MIELEGQPCLVVGGGPVALHKASVLLAFGADVTLVSPGLADDDIPSGLMIRRRPFHEDDLNRMSLVVAATDDPKLNGSISVACRARAIPVNVVDDPANCTFAFPAIFHEGPVVAAFSSGGKCPVAARLLRDRFARAVPKEFLGAIGNLAERRAELKRDYPDFNERRKVYERELAPWKE